jgi:hypothetical protein
VADPNLIIVGHNRPYPGETLSGDLWSSFDTDAGTRIVLVDGAGHGAQAHAAARIALDAMSETALPAEQALKLCHSRLQGTRGAVISIVDIRPDSLSFTGVGNVDARFFAAGVNQQRLTPDRGLLGAALPRLHTWSIALTSPDWRLLLFSDGVVQRMTVTWDDIASLDDPQSLVSSLVERWGRSTDDATAVLAAPHPLAVCGEP